ncbi:hypothetical protein [Longitalea arenae]|uniref:hypothetical protein n=1 Tax=Longitalea arenae TaxID=2812558 RepID=UPI00196836D9|nr:hypothetical protein [Longitalea arenae]
MLGKNEHRETNTRVSRTTIEPPPEKGVWNSLEVVKILVALLTPIAIFVFTKQTNEKLDQNNKLLHNNNRVFENRQAFYDKVGTLLNDLYCYHIYVGHWKDITPLDIIKKKRILDQIVYTYSPYFDTPFKSAYDAFMTATFKPYQKMGGDAKIRSEYKVHFDYCKKDSSMKETEFAEMFSEEDNRTQVFNTYFSLLKEIAKELNLTVDYSIYKMPDQKPDPK